MGVLTYLVGMFRQPWWCPGHRHSRAVVPNSRTDELDFSDPRMLPEIRYIYIRTTSEQSTYVDFSNNAACFGLRVIKCLPDIVDWPKRYAAKDRIKVVATHGSEGRTHPDPVNFLSQYSRSCVSNTSVIISLSLSLFATLLVFVENRGSVTRSGTSSTLSVRAANYK